jgi:outer membrane protein assembly factor BamD (BamD/ComL family)
MRTIANTFLIFCAAAVLSLESSAQSAPFEQAMQLFQQRQWAEAAAAFAECDKNDPGKTTALLYRGKSLVNLGQLEEAAAALERYAQTHTQSEDAAYLLAYIRFRQN